MSEILVLDPAEVAYNRTELDITDFVGEAGPDFGDAAIENFLAEGYRGQIPVDFRVPNRIVTIPLVLYDSSSRTFDQMRQFVQAKAALIQREGGWIKRQVGDNPVYADVVGATLHLGGSTAQAISDTDADAVLTLECIPDFYGDEISLGDHSETTLPELVFTETGIKGDFPARCRLVVDEDQGVNQLGLVWGVRSRHYNSAATARLAYRATGMTALDAASGSSGIMVQHATVGKGWTPVLSTDLTSGGSLTHTGTYRVFARVASGTGGADLQARLVWDVGDMSNPVENRPWTFPVPSQGFFYIADLGEVRVDAVRAGVHKWVAQVQAKAVNEGAASFGIRDLWFVPVDDGFGRMAAAAGNTSTFTSYSIRDDFNQTAGALTGKTVQTGGLWARAGTDDADDFVVDFTEHNAKRTAVSDIGPWDGRYALAGTTNLANSAAYVLFAHSAFSGSTASAVLLRYTDITHWLMGRVVSYQQAANYPTLVQLEVWKRNGAVPVKLGGPTRYQSLGTSPWSVQMSCDTAGRFNLWAGPGSALDLIVSGSDSELATGGALASGRQGFYDVQTSAPANTRSYDFFGAWVPDPDATMFANQSVELTTAGMLRETAAGGSYGPVAHVVGDLPRLPPSGLEGRTCEVFVKASRGDFDTVPDCFPNSIVADNISAQLFYRPSWLFVPEVVDIGIGSLFPALDLFPAPDLYPEF